MLPWTEEEKERSYELVHKNGVYAFVPCFSELCIDLSGNQYAYQKVDKLDLDTNIMSVTMRMYQRINGFWEPGVKLSVDIFLEKMAEAILKHELMNDAADTPHHMRFEGYRVTDYLSYEDMYLQVPWNELHMSPVEECLWDNTLKNARETGHRSSDYANIMFYLFVHVNMRVNAYLLDMKPKTVRMPKNKDNDKKTKTVVTAEKDETPIIRTRRLGKLTVKSKKPPKLHDEKTIRRYKTASWKVRAHPRHYKNGRVIWIDERVHKRKAMNTSVLDEPKTRKNIIVLKNDAAKNQKTRKEN